MDPAVASSLNVQAQIRRNAEEQANFLRGMGDWEKEIKQRDAELKTKKKAKAKARRAAAPRQRESGGTVKTKMTISKATAEDFQISKEAKDTIDSKSRGEIRGLGSASALDSAHPQLPPSTPPRLPREGSLLGNWHGRGQPCEHSCSGGHH